MPRGLTERQIEQVTRELLARHRRVTVRQVMLSLHAKFGSCGRTERVCQILKRVESEPEAPRVTSSAAVEELEALREKVRMAEARAALSEERERQHQDLWAARYAEKITQLDRQQSHATKTVGVTHEQYLRVYQRAAELARRLAKYEDPDKPAGVEAG